MASPHLEQDVKKDRRSLCTGAGRSGEILLRLKEPCIFLFCLFVSAVFITINSKCSPLYPLQDWVDSQCFYTVGKAIAHGQVLYQDIFDQKGPVLYFLYALTYRLFPDTYIGVYLLEMLSFGAFLYFAAKCMRLYVDKPVIVYGMVPLLAFLITTSNAFVHGGSAEELSLFCYAYTLYSFLRMYRQDAFRRSHAFCNGVCLAFVFWIKYTMIGLQVGVILAMLVFLFAKRRFREIPRMLLYGFLGFLAMSLPVLIYFAVHRAGSALWDGYFYHNLFLYTDASDAGSTLYGMFYALFSCIRKNLGFIIPAFVGLVWVLTRRNFETVLTIVAAVTSSIFIFIGGLNHAYYGLPLSVFALFGLTALADWCGRITQKRLTVFLTAIALIAAIASPFLSLKIGPNVPFMSKDRRELAQYRFAEIMNADEAPTLLNYGFLDGGFYYAAGIVPSTRHFCTLNLTSPEIEAEINAYVAEGETDYIVTRGQKLEDLFNSIPYECIAEAPYSFENLNGSYYLYKKISPDKN